MVLAVEAPLPAETTGKRLPEHMQRRVDALDASGVESILHSYLPTVSEAHAKIPGVTLAEARIMRRPSVSVDKTAAIGINVVGHKDTGFHAEAITRVEAVDTDDPNTHNLVVAYFDRSPKNPREQKWVTVTDYAYTQGDNPTDRYLAVPIDRTDPVQIESQQETLQFQIELALSLAHTTARPAEERRGQVVDIVSFMR